MKNSCRNCKFKGLEWNIEPCTSCHNLIAFEKWEPIEVIEIIEPKKRCSNCKHLNVAHGEEPCRRCDGPYSDISEWEPEESCENCKYSMIDEDSYPRVDCKENVGEEDHWEPKEVTETIEPEEKTLENSSPQLVHIITFLTNELSKKLSNIKIIKDGKEINYDKRDALRFACEILDAQIEFMKGTK